MSAGPDDTQPVVTVQNGFTIADFDDPALPRVPFNIMTFRQSEHSQPPWTIRGDAGRVDRNYVM